MIVENNFSIEIKREGGYLRGFAVVDGVRQLIDIVPRGVEGKDLINFFANHLFPAVDSGRQGRVAFRKGKN